MLILLIIFGTLLLSVLALITARMELMVNTLEDVYTFRFGWLAKAWVIPDEEELLYFKFRILFFKREFHLWDPPTEKQLKKRAKRKAKRERKAAIRKEKGKPAKKRRKMPKRLVQRLRRILGTFRVRRLEMNLDTGSPIANGLLYPAFARLNQNQANDLRINFDEDFSLNLWVTNSPWRLAWAWLRKK